MTTIANYAALGSYSYTPGDESVFVQGRLTIGDGGQGMFFWDPLNTSNYYGIIIQSPATTGRWKRLYSDYVNVAWFGAIGDVTTVLGSITSGSNVLDCTGSDFTSADIGKKITVNGASTAVSILNALGTYDNIPAALSSSITAVNSATEVVLADYATTAVSASDVNYGTDDTSTIQNAINTVSAMGGGAVFFQAGKYAISSSLTIKGEVHILGESKYDSIIYAIADGFTLVNYNFGSPTPQPGAISVKNICLWGYGDRFTYQNVPGTYAGTICYLMSLSNYQYIEVDNCYGRWSREMGFAVRGGIVTITNNLMENILRDGINAGDAQRVIMTGNRGRFIEDDFLAADCSGVSDGMQPTGMVDNIAIVCNNETFCSQGITVGGTRNVVIANNNLSFIKGRAIRCSVETASGGQIESLNVVIANNNIKDLIKLCTPELNYGADPAHLGKNTYPNDVTNLRYSASSSADGIELGFTVSMAVPPTIPGDTSIVYPGTFDSYLQMFVKPELYWNFESLTGPHGQSRGVIVTNNSIMQSVSGLTEISDAYGYGLWTRKGFTDAAYQGSICLANGASQQNGYYKSYGITIGGPNKGLKIINNYIYGFQRGIYFTPEYWRTDITIKDNTIERTLCGVYLDVTTTSPGAYPVDISIDKNTFDPDPFLEATDRYTTAPTVTITDANISSGSNILTTTTSTPFTSGDVGKVITIPGAGFVGTLNFSPPSSATADSLTAQINVVNSSNSVQISINAITSVTNQTITAFGFLTGAWTNVLYGYYHAVLAPYAVGIKVLANNFKNTKDIVGANSTTNAFVYSNNYYCDPVNKTGIDTLSNLSTNNVFWINSAPGNFQDALLLINNSGLTESSTQPTGYFVENQIIRNSSPVTDANGFVLFGWLRLTTGSGTSSSDWQPMYISSTSFSKVAPSSILNQTATTQTAAFKISGAGTILGGLTIATGLNPSLDNGINLGGQTLRWRQIWGGFGHIGDPNILDNSAMFQIDSTTRGFLPTRMTNSQRLAVTTPADGLLVYQTDGTSGLYEYNAASSAWRRIYQNIPKLEAVTASGTGTATTINIPHLLGAIPSWFSATATNSAAANISYVTADITNIIINYATSPAAGTNNLAYNISFIA